MAKRFTATDKWDDPWFCGLSDSDKLFWFYLLDKCDHAGIWQVNWPLATFHVKGTINKESFKDRVKVLSPEKWFIQKFIDFQYGTLDSNNRAHKSVINILQKEGAYKPLRRSLQGRKDMDMVKDKDKDSSDKEDFLSFWSAYPKKTGIDVAQASWLKKRPPLDKCLAAITWLKKTDQWTKEGGKYIPMPSTWINQGRWNDEPVKTVTSGAAPVPGKYDQIKTYEH